VPLLLLLASITAFTALAALFVDIRGGTWGWGTLLVFTIGTLALSWFAGRRCNMALVIEVLRAIKREQKQPTGQTCEAPALKEASKT
jgi:hypothetical protein